MTFPAFVYFVTNTLFILQQTDERCNKGSENPKDYFGENAADSRAFSTLFSYNGMRREKGMDAETVSLLMLAVLGGAGGVLAALGIVLLALEKRKRRACIAKTQGRVVRYYFLNDAPSPVVEYEADGKIYRAKRRFRAVVKTQRIMLPSDFGPHSSGLFIDENDVVHIRTGAILNLRELAEKQYPLGSSLEVLYDPKRPKRAYVEKIPLKLPLTVPILIGAGVGLVGLGAVIRILIG